MIPKLDLRCLHPEDSDEEVGTFSSNEENHPFSFLYFLLVPSFWQNSIMNFLVNKKYIFIVFIFQMKSLSSI